MTTPGICPPSGGRGSQGYALVATGVGVVLGGLTVRLVLGADASGWDAVAVLVAVAVAFAALAAVVSEPLLSRWLDAARRGD